MRPGAPPRITARAPGKMAVLGEYAVLAGAPALVLAVDRYATATIDEHSGGACELQTRAGGEVRRINVAAGAESGVAIVDLVRGVGRSAAAGDSRVGTSTGEGRAARVALGSPAGPAGGDAERMGTGGAGAAGGGAERMGSGGAGPAGGGAERMGSGGAGAAGSGAERMGSGQAELRSWRAVLDTADFFVDGRKLGLGSSAAALVAFAGAWAAWNGWPPPTLDHGIDLHRRFQRGAGSGLDVAAACVGGAIVFRRDAGGVHHVSSVQLPNSVGFAGIFAGRSASTPDLLALYHRWWAEKPGEAADRQRILVRIAESGCAAAGRGESEELLHAVEQYGRELDALGHAIGADIVTAEHRALAETAARFGVVYKVSGAGGGDLGIGLSTDGDALAAFRRAAADAGFLAVDLAVDRHGLVIEERRQ